MLNKTESGLFEYNRFNLILVMCLGRASKSVEIHEKSVEIHETKNCATEISKLMTDERATPISIDVSAKAELKGEASTEIVDRAVGSLLDAVAPFTEGMGLVGDRIRAYRYDVAIRIAKRAKHIVDETGGTLTPPPVKFSVPFIEHSSLEGEDEDIEEMWAHLLAEASSEFKSAHYGYVRVLSEIGPDEAKLLDSMFIRLKHGRKILPSTESIRKEIQSEVSDQIAGFDDELVGEVKHPVGETKAAELGERILNVALDEHAAIVSVHMPFKCENRRKSNDLDEIDEEKIKAWSISSKFEEAAYLLERQRLAEVCSVELPSIFGDVKIRVAVLTNLGENFLEACGY